MKQIEFRDHRVWQVMAHVLGYLSQQVDTFRPNESTNEVKSKISYANWVLMESDPSYYSAEELELVARDIDGIADLIFSDPNLSQNYARITSILSNILSRNSYPRQRRIFRSEANSIISSLGKTSDEYKVSFSELLEQTDNLKRVLNESEARYKELVKNRQIEVNLLNAKLEEKYSVWELNYNTQANKMLSDFQNERATEFRIEFDRISKEITKTRESLELVKNNSEEQESNIAEKFQSQLSHQKAEAEGIIEKLNELYQEAGNLALSGGFSAAAALEVKSYAGNALLAKICFGVAGIIMAVGYFITFDDGDHDVMELLLRLPTSIPLLIPGVYFSALASQHRRTSVHLQSLGLRIKAFGSYIAQADQEQQRKLREEMAKVFFAESEADGFRSRTSVGFLGDILTRTFAVSEKIAEKVVDKAAQKHL